MQSGEGKKLGTEAEQLRRTDTSMTLRLGTEATHGRRMQATTFARAYIYIYRERERVRRKKGAKREAKNKSTRVVAPHVDLTWGPA